MASIVPPTPNNFQNTSNQSFETDILFGMAEQSSGFVSSGIGYAVDPL